MSNASSVPRHELAPLRVLVVEDEKGTADAMAKLLELHGHETIAAYDGRTALEKAEAEAPDVILLDIGLPGLDGYVVAEQIKARMRVKWPLIIAVTGYKDEQRSYAAGIDLHMAKPIDPSALRGILDRFRSVVG